MKKLTAAVSVIVMLSGCASEAELVSFGEDLPVIVETAPVEVPISYELSDIRSDSELCKMTEDSKQRRDFSMRFASFPAVSGPKLLDRIGSTKIALIPIDWREQPGSSDDLNYYKQQAENLTNFYRVMSQGRHQIDWVVADSWFRVDINFEDFKIPYGGDASYEEESISKKEEFLDALVSVSDPYFDFSDIDVVNFVTPRGFGFDEGIYGFADASFGGQIRTNEKVIGNYFIPGKHEQDDFYSPAWIWYAHEYAHTLGFPDVRNSEESGYQDVTAVAHELMGLSWGPIRYFSVWLRWVAEWVDNEQVICLTPDQITENIYEIHTGFIGSEDTLAVMVRFSETETVVIESRRNQSFDAITDIGEGNRYEGVVIYTVDSNMGHSEGFMQSVYPDGREDKEPIIWDEEGFGMGSELLNVVFHEGDFVEIYGISIEVLQTGDGKDVVSLSY